MNHINDDALLKRVLQLLEKDDLEEQDRHLSGCSLCTTRLAEISDETNILGSIEPDIQVPEIPLPRSDRSLSFRLMKIAALLIIGFVAGYAVSRSSGISLVTIVPYQVSHATVQPPLSQFTVCE